MAALQASTSLSAWVGKSEGEEPAGMDATMRFSTSQEQVLTSGPDAGAAAAATPGHADGFLRGEALIFAWGAGEDGQLGQDKDFSDHQQLQLIRPLVGKQVTAIVGGSRNSLAITATGQVFLWGWNQRSTLGHPYEEKKQNKEGLPSTVSALKSERVSQAAVGGWHVLAVTDRGTSFAWGGNEYGQCAFQTDKSLLNRANARDIRLPITCASHLRIRQVAAGGTHSLALTEQGEVWTWGQPWPPANNKEQWIPSKIQGLSNVASIVAGAFHNVALLEGGAGVCTWGDNEYGQLGSGNSQPRSLPYSIPQLQGLHVVDVAAGGWHTMAVTAEGKLYAWGRGEHGRLGMGDDRASKMLPVQVALLDSETIVQVACGGTHSVALTLDGRMFAFGRKDNGRLGPLASSTTGHPVRVPLPGDLFDTLTQEESSTPRADFPLRTASVSCGGRHTLALACHEQDLDHYRRSLPWVRAWQKDGALFSLQDSSTNNQLTQAAAGTGA